MPITALLEACFPAPAESRLVMALRQPHGSVPANPLLAESLYLSQYIERLGIGTDEMIRPCRDAGLPEPAFALDDGFRLTLERPAPQASTPATP